MANMLTRRREPFLFMLQLGIVGSSLLFFFILFVFIRKSWGNPLLTIPLPMPFWLSTVVLLASSVTLGFGRRAFQQEYFTTYRWGVGLTFGLSLVFLLLQLYGWRELLSEGITMANHTGASFLYILSGLHIVHTLGGIVALGVAVRDAFTHRSYVDTFVFSVNPPNQLRLKLITYYWHFIDVLWLIIFFFLLAYAP